MKDTWKKCLKVNQYLNEADSVAELDIIMVSVTDFYTTMRYRMVGDG